MDRRCSAHSFCWTVTWRQCASTLPMQKQDHQSLCPIAKVRWGDAARSNIPVPWTLHSVGAFPKRRLTPFPCSIGYPASGSSLLQCSLSQRSMILTVPSDNSTLYELSRLCRPHTAIATVSSSSSASLGSVPKIGQLCTTMTSTDCTFSCEMVVVHRQDLRAEHIGLRRSAKRIAARPVQALKTRAVASFLRRLIPRKLVTAISCSAADELATPPSMQCPSLQQPSEGKHAFIDINLPTSYTVQSHENVADMQARRPIYTGTRYPYSSCARIPSTPTSLSTLLAWSLLLPSGIASEGLAVLCMRIAECQDTGWH